MQTSTTASTNASPLRSDTVRRLGALRPGVPVLSIIVGLDPREFAMQPARDSAFTSILDDAHRRIEEYKTGHDGRMSLRADLERARTFLEDAGPIHGSGVALFAASSADLFEAYQLPRAPRSCVVIDDSPYVTPLLAAADERDWLIVVVDARNARFLHGNAAHVEELEHAHEHIAGQHERQSTSDHQRWVENQIDHHLKRAADQVDRMLGGGRFDKVVIGGPEEIAARFEATLSNPARERLAGRFAVEVPDTIADDIRTAVAGCFEEDERDRERAVLARLEAGLGRGERAAAGYADVRAMLEQGRVETLLYDERFEAPHAGALEQAIEDAVAQSAEVLPLRHLADELDEQARIAAVLRF
jgi:peptide subunit release factor 1 (eRF1)